MVWVASAPVHVGRRRLVAGADDDLVDVDVRGPGQGPADALGDVLGAERLHPLVYAGGGLLVAREANERELGLDHPGGDLGDPHWLAEQLAAQNPQGRPLGVLGGVVAGAAGVGLDRGDAGDRDDVPVAGGDQQRQQGAGHPHRPHHVRLVHLQPLRFVGLGDRIDSKRTAGVVDEHVAGLDLAGKGGDRLGIGDVELDCPSADLPCKRLQAVEAAGGEDRSVALPSEGYRGGGADAARSPRDHSRSHRRATLAARLGPLATPGPRSAEISVSSRLDAPPAQVWERVIAPEGINDEMRPYMRMTIPAGVDSLDPESVVLGEKIGRSWVLLFGLVPFDYDDLVLVELEPGHRFLERSTMLSQRAWEHERTIEPNGDSACTIADRVRWQPRLGLPARPLRPFIGWFFRHRHKRLRRCFGGEAVADAQ